jgi:hypothetical protein
MRRIAHREKKEILRHSRINARRATRKTGRGQEENQRRRWRRASCYDALHISGITSMLKLCSLAKNNAPRCAACAATPVGTNGAGVARGSVMA